MFAPRIILCGLNSGVFRIYLPKYLEYPRFQPQRVNTGFYYKQQCKGFNPSHVNIPHKISYIQTRVIFPAKNFSDVVTTLKYIYVRVIFSREMSFLEEKPACVWETRRPDAS